MANLLLAIFFGHGNPMNAVMTNAYTDAWRRVGEETERPRAILSISAHWFVPGTGVTISTAPRTIHDFRGFPRELYTVQYPAPGDPALARRAQALLAPMPVMLDDSCGLDHGTWSVLKHVYPAADIPIVQLSIDETKPPAFHNDIGRRLAPLREEGVLIVGSRNLVHLTSTRGAATCPIRTIGPCASKPKPRPAACRRSQAARQLRVDGPRSPSVYSHAGSLPAAAIRNRSAPEERRHQLPP